MSLTEVPCTPDLSLTFGTFPITRGAQQIGTARVLSRRCVPAADGGAGSLSLTVDAAFDGSTDDVSRPPLALVTDGQRLVAFEVTAAGEKRSDVRLDEHGCDCTTTPCTCLRLDAHERKAPTMTERTADPEERARRDMQQRNATRHLHPLAGPGAVSASTPARTGPPKTPEQRLDGEDAELAAKRRARERQAERVRTGAGMVSAGSFDTAGGRGAMRRLDAGPLTPGSREWARANSGHGTPDDDGGAAA